MTRQAIRQARKAIGLPASADVGHLANIISALRSAVEEHLQTTIDSAGITIMHLAALCPEDLRDACEYARLAYLSFPMRYKLLYETITAYTGYDYGLCHDYRDREGCKREQDNIDWDVVIAVLFTPTVLTVTLSMVQSAYYLFEPDYRHYANFHLGYNSPARRENRVGYWDAVADQLEMIIRENPYYERPDKVLLIGDCVHDRDFRAALIEALSNQNSTPNILDYDAAYVAAKGAAELTRRLP